MLQQISVSLPCSKRSIVGAFPRKNEDLPRLELAELGPLRFTSLAPEIPFSEALAPLVNRLRWLPWDDLVFAPERSREYDLDAHWALYCDNYLEGFHIPFVHPGLSRVLKVGAYENHVLPCGTIQVGIVGDDEPALELPAKHPVGDKRIGALYLWLFPTTMLNLYPWGLSLNRIEPQGPRRTRVRFQTWIWRPDLVDRGAGAGLEQVEMEDEAVVIGVQRGLRSRRAPRGRYSPQHEKGTHHFHRLLAKALA